MVEKNLAKSNRSGRQLPRRRFHHWVGVLSKGTYKVVQAVELGEGGMKFQTLPDLKEHDQIVITFFIPQHQFVSLRSEVRYLQKEDGQIYCGVAFTKIDVLHRRKI